MEKTKLGISVGLFGALTYLAAYMSGFFVTILIVGYVMLMESNEWLKKTVVKALITLAFFSILSVAIGFIPQVINFITDFINIFGTSIYLNVVNKLFGELQSLISIIQIIVYFLLAWKSLSQETIEIPVVDSLINKYL